MSKTNDLLRQQSQVLDEMNFTEADRIEALIQGMKCLECSYAFGKVYKYCDKCAALLPQSNAEEEGDDGINRLKGDDYGN
jgi:hypothetical protein